MPPKRSGRNDSRNKQRQEEAERLAREEEERRKIEEEERRLKEEQEKLEREEREKREAEERKCLDLEKKEYDGIRENILGRIEDYLSKQKEEYEWVHYTSCSLLPLVSDERALNTYITIFKEQPHPSSLDNAFDRLKDLYKLIVEVVKEGKELHTNLKYKQLNDVVSEELDWITLFLMEHANGNIDPETFNLTVEGEIQGHIQYCLWGNVVKNPRLKNFAFKTIGFELDLPKSMLLADVALRVMYLTYDTFSPRSRTYHCPTMPSTPMEVNSVEDQGEVRLEDLVSGTPTALQQEGDTASVKSQKTPASSRPTSRASTATGGKKTPKSAERRKAKTPTIPEKESEIEPTQQEDNSENKPDEKESTTEKDSGNDDKEAGPSTDLEEDEVDLRSYRPSGGVILLDLYTLPPQSKTIQEWTLTQVIVDGLKPAPHPVDPSGTKVPVSITLSLPEHYYFLDTDSVLLAVWDEENSIWRTNGLQDVSFDLEQRIVSFKTLQFAPLAIMSELYVNFPYQSWELVPVGVNHNLFTIVGGSVEVTISIEKDICTVIRPLDNSIVAKILNIPMSVEKIIQSLTDIGYNFFPEPDVDKHASRTNKSKTIEATVYEGMAMSCGGWAFTWNKFNSKCDSKKIVLSSAQCSENKWEALISSEPENTITSIVEWIQVICTDTKCYQLEISNDTEEFTDQIKDGQMAHSDLYTLLLKLVDPQIHKFMTDCHPIHIHTIEKLLSAVKPLTST